MKSTFAGFSEEDLKQIKSGTPHASNDPTVSNNLRKINRLGGNARDIQRRNYNFKSCSVQSESAGEMTDDINFDKCKLNLVKSLSPTKNLCDDLKGENRNLKLKENLVLCSEQHPECHEETSAIEINNIDKMEKFSDDTSRKSSIGAPDLVKALSNPEQTDMKVNLEELQLKQKMMEEQNRKRKEMLSKALADRTRKTEEEVLRLEKIKKELQVLDGQFSQDVAVLRKKIDQACLSYAETEKHYLKIEKEFLQAKISLQKEREKKELLTEHLCALITHNETRKAQKLETLMLELATDRKISVSENNVVISSENDVTSSNNVEITTSNNFEISSDEESIVIDGVCQKTGKFVNIEI